MASQITHIVLADKLHPIYFSHFPQELFLMGNVFPDIRTPAHLDRRLTHLPAESVTDIQAEPDAFIAGVKLHSLIDVVREDFIERQGAYELFHSQSFPPTIFKQFEDRQLYDKITDWPKIISYLDTLPKQAEQFGVSDAVMLLWNRALQDYFAHPTSQKVRIEFLKVAKPDSAANAAEFATIIRRLQANPRAKAIARALYDNIGDLLPKT